MRSKNHLERLKLLGYVDLGLLIIGTVFFAGSHYIVGGLLFLCAFLLDWLGYRCPHCHAWLESRMKLDEEVICPHCGRQIAS